MRTHEIAKAVLVVAAALSASRAAATSVSARAGLAYTQQNQWFDGGGTSESPRLDLTLALDGRGAVFQPGVLDWNLRASWQRVNDELNGVTTDSTKMLLYNGNVSAFGRLGSPLTLSLGASRVQTDFITDLDLNQFGQTVSQSLGGSLALRVNQLPGLSANYAQTRSEESIPGLPLHESTMQSIGSAVSFGTPAFNFRGSYAGELRDGSWVADKLDVHMVDVSARAGIGSNASLTISDTIQLAVPTSLVPGSYEQEISVFRATLNSKSAPGSRHAGTYTYGRSLLETATTPAREVVHQGLHYAADISTKEAAPLPRLDDALAPPDVRWFVRWSVDASMSQERLGDVESHSTGETAGVQLWFMRSGMGRSLSLFGGPLLALLQSNGGSSALGYGAAAGTRLGQPWRNQTLGLGYNVNYGTSLNGAPGWSLVQTGSASSSGALATGRYAGTFNASAFRTWSPLFGDGAGRRLELVLNADFRDVRYQLRARRESGIIGATPSQFVGDGLLVPAPFNSSTSDLAFSASWKVYVGLHATGRLRIASSDRPGAPPISQEEALVGLGYAYGGFTMALQDSVVRNGPVTGNIVSFSISRGIAF